MYMTPSLRISIVVSRTNLPTNSTKGNDMRDYEVNVRFHENSEADPEDYRCTYVGDGATVYAVYYDITGLGCIEYYPDNDGYANESDFELTGNPEADVVQVWACEDRIPVRRLPIESLPPALILTIQDTMDAHADTDIADPDWWETTVQVIPLFNTRMSFNARWNRP